MLKKIASNTISQILSKVGTAIISIYLISVLTNYLTIDLYGLYLKIYNYIGIFVFLADLGLYTIAIREISANPEDTKKIVGNVMSLRLILGIIIFLLAIGIAFFLPGYDSTLALWSITIVSIFTIFQLLNSSVLTLMQAKMKIEFSLFSAIVGKMVNLGVVVSIAYFFFQKGSENFDYFEPFLWIIGASVLSIGVNTAMNYWYARKLENFGFSFDWMYIKHLIKISLPYGIALFLSVVYFKIDIILLSLLDGQGDRSIAFYSLPMKIVEVIMVLGGFYLNSILPSLTQMYKKKDLSSMEKILSTSLRILITGGTMIFVMGVLFRDHLIKIIANEDYLSTASTYNSSDAFLVVFAVVLFHFISLVFIYTLIATNEQSKLLRINIIVTIINIIGNIVLIPHYSFIGAGVTTIISQILLMILGYYFSKNIVKVDIVWIEIIKDILVGTVLYVIFSHVLENYHLGLHIDLFVYGLILGFIYVLYFLWKYLPKTYWHKKIF
ncbi:MAG: oligosaccharide flippase family protein [Candidatus Gracilibacteria bacterium]|nr:oligosaccharide flippase family protein [Candidatus Gracilibacteria bacterium]